ncbi:MAG: prolipoprotein diacylglyceryl transferase [Gemmatimonadetes bacterium]|nr:prolipoprotein diacylglyceryl transferase [Gemmatimonadota bacterium]
MTLASLNRALDALPRTRFGRLSREVPAFRTCGVTGFYVAVATTFGAALLAGRELLPAAGLCLVCAFSFFLYVYVRKWITGREQLVLLQQVWLAELCCALALRALGLPVLAWLDVIAPGMAFFLAAGRVGCTLAGCCHGRPSLLGLRYGDEHAAHGFPRHLVGIRLFPVQPLEAMGLAAIGVTSLVAIPFAAPGRVFAWFLAAYAVLRFGTEGMRGDERAHALGLSQARWMALAELGVAMWITRTGDAPVRDAVLAALLVAALAAALLAMRHFDRRPARLSAANADELRRAVAEAASVAEPGDAPRLHLTAAGTLAGVTAAPGGWTHVSLSHPHAPAELETLCALAARAFPALAPEDARAGEAGVLHLALRDPAASGETDPARGDALYGAVVRRLQSEAAQAVPPGHSADHDENGAAGPADDDAAAAGWLAAERPDGVDRATPAADGARAYFLTPVRGLGGARDGAGTR